MQYFIKHRGTQVPKHQSLLWKNYLPCKPMQAKKGGGNCVPPQTVPDGDVPVT